MASKSRRKPNNPCKIFRIFHKGTLIFLKIIKAPIIKSIDLNYCELIHCIFK